MVDEPTPSVLLPVSPAPDVVLGESDESVVVEPLVEDEPPMVVPP